MLLSTRAFVTGVEEKVSAKTGNTYFEVGFASGNSADVMKVMTMDGELLKNVKRFSEYDVGFNYNPETKGLRLVGLTPVKV